MNTEHAALDVLCINTIRTLAVDAVQKANSGHPGLPLGAAPMAYVLYQQHLRHDPEHPDWWDRDRFVLSAGHGSGLLYALLHLTGYDLSLEDLKSFRQWNSRTPGHPEYGMTPGVEATTGPLGQGTAQAVGMAVAERMMAARYNRPGHTLFDHFTYALVSDGDLMEGIAAEAASLAGHWRLGRLIHLYDANDVSLDGPTDLCFTEDVARRYEALGWHVQTVKDGDRDLAAIDAALTAARAEQERPSLILVKSTIGFGSPGKAGTSAAHGSPLGEEEVARTKEALGWDPSWQFHVPEEAAARFAEGAARGRGTYQEWQARHEAWAAAHPALAAELIRVQAGELPGDFAADLPRFEAGAKVATRAAGGKVLNALARRVPELAGGDADLSCSTKTALEDAGSFDGVTGAGRNLHFGVREHAMGAIANGMALHGGVRPYTSTFFCFSDYMRGAVRLAALSHLPVVTVWTHDSVAVGEDGPTHQPVEHLASLRAMPNLHVMRPADATETAEAWKQALLRRDGPTALVLSRQGLPVLDRARLAPADGVARGGYVLSEADSGEPEALIIATGSEVSLALEAQSRLAAEGVSVRVVSLPCWELFQAQEAAWRDQVLPPSISARVSVEAGATLGWERWVGSDGVCLGVDRFGASAPGDEVLERLGMTADAVCAAVREVIGGGSSRSADAT